MRIDFAFAALRCLEPRGTPLDYARVDLEQARAMPILGWLRDYDKLSGIVRFREYRFEWPERIVMDTVLDAQRIGAVARNYTPVVGLAQEGDGWAVTLADGLGEAGQAVVQAKAVLNMAGTWIDRVNRMAKPDVGRRITGTKGIHLMLRLPPECRSFGIFALNRVNEPMFIAPWRGLHYIGPTETLYEGDLDDVRATEDEIAWQIDEANHLLPGAGFKRSDVLFTWAGVRPLTYDPEQPAGARARLIHDMGEEGLPNMLALSDSRPARRARHGVGGATSGRNGPPPITRTTFPTCRAQYPGGSERVPMSVASPFHAAFPVSQAGRHPRFHFRGLLRLHSRYGPLDRSTAQGGLCHEASRRPVTQPPRSSATRSTDNSLDGTFLHW